MVIIVDAFKSKRITLLRRFLMERQRATGCKAEDGAFTKREAEELLKLGWITKSEKGIYFRAWHTMLKGRSKAMATFPASAFDGRKTTLKVLMYLAVVRHLYRVQEKQPIREGRTSNGVARRKRTSLHNGGVAHSLVCEVFGCTKSWSSKMRALCMKVGAATFTRRWEVCDEYDCLNAPADLVPSGVFRTHDGFAMELASEFQFHIPIGIQWCRRR